MSRSVELRDAKGLEVTTRSGHLLIIAEPDRVNVEIDGLLEQSKKSQVWRQSGRLHIRSARGSNMVTVRCPVGTNLSAASHSGYLELRGDLGDVRLQNQSGRIQVERARSVDARTKNGRIEVAAVHGLARGSTASGSVDINRAQSARAASVSGSISFTEIRGAASAMSVSGSVKIETNGGGDIHVATVSGSVEVRVPQNLRPMIRTKRKSGSLKVECEEGTDLSVNVATVSGSVRVRNHRARVTV